MYMFEFALSNTMQIICTVYEQNAVYGIKIKKKMNFKYFLLNVLEIPCIYIKNFKLGIMIF